MFCVRHVRPLYGNPPETSQWDRWVFSQGYGQTLIIEIKQNQEENVTHTTIVNK